MDRLFETENLEIHTTDYNPASQDGDWMEDGRRRTTHGLVPCT